MNGKNMELVVTFFFAYQECGLRVNLFNILPIPVLVALGDLKELKFPSYRTQGHAQK